MSISLILEVIVALPKIIGMVLSLVKEIKKASEDAKQKRLADAIGLAQSAQNVDQTRAANESITSNLP